MKEWKTVSLLTAVGLLYRLLHYFIFSDRIVAGSDVMQNILLARRFASGDLYGVLDTYWTPVYPILVGIVSIFMDDLVLPAVIVSMIAGCLAVPLTYYLAKQSYGERVALIASVIAIFFPYLLNSVFALGLENIYLIWMTGAIIVGWNALSRGSIKLNVLTGALLGLGYLTRPEAIGYPILFVLLAAGDALVERKLLDRRWMLGAAALLIGFLLIAAPYIFYLKQATGTWTVSGKAGVNVSAGHFADGEEGVRPPVAGDSAKVLAVNFLMGFREVQKSVANLLPFLLIVFLTLGLLGRRWEKDRTKREIYLLAFCAFTALGYAASVVQDRYFYVLLPIFFGWIALGIVRFGDWFVESFEGRFPGRSLFLLRPNTIAAASLLLIFVYMFSVNFYIRSRESAWQGSAYEERDAGAWLASNGKSSPKILSESFRPVFYARGEQIWIDSDDPKEFIAEAKRRRADYVFDSERTHKRLPELAGLAERLKNDPEFELVYHTQEPGYNTWIFKLK